MMTRVLLPIAALMAASSANASIATMISRFSVTAVLPTGTATKIVTDLGVSNVSLSGAGGWSASQQSPLVMVSTLQNIPTIANPVVRSNALMKVDGSVKLENLADKEQFFWLVFRTAPTLTSFTFSPGPPAPSSSYSIPLFGSWATFGIDYDDPNAQDYTAQMGGNYTQTGPYPLRTLVGLAAMSSATVAYSINVNATLLSVVPEPMVWQSLIIGFGAIGAVMRRRQTALTASAG